MQNQAGNYFGSSIDTAEIADGAVTLAKLAGDAQLSLISLPIGGIIPWLKSYTNTPALGSNFVECNGQTLSDASSVYNGQVIPNLNGSAGTQRFLRGSTTSGTTGGSETHSHSVTQTDLAGATGGTHTGNNVSSTGSTSTLPSYYEVVFVMRVK